MKINNDSNEAVVITKSEDSLLGISNPTVDKQVWISPQLREFGNLSFVVKGISYNPLDGLSNLTP